MHPCLQYYLIQNQIPSRGARFLLWTIALHTVDVFIGKYLLIVDCITRHYSRNWGCSSDEATDKSPLSRSRYSIFRDGHTVTDRTHTN